MSALAPPTSRDRLAARAVHALERGGDRLFGAHANPLRQLGALAVLLFWIALGSGAYIYIFYDTSAALAHASIEALSRDQPWLGGLIRSLHRYSADAFAAVTALHILREWALGRYAGFRWFSWVSGVPLLWLALGSGLVGYWLVADTRALFVATSIAEWAGWLPGFGAGLMRNFITEEAISDRLFSLLIFLHIGLALFVLLGLWIHLQRITHAVTQPQRQLAVSISLALLVLCAVWPALSTPPADFSELPLPVPIDWFYLGVFPLMYATSPGFAWGVVGLGSGLLLILPWTSRKPVPPPAVVELAHCNGCGRCFDDCPFGAIVLVARNDARRHAVQAVVEGDACASCGICVGACPSSTPFRSAQQLVTGIDLPAQPLSGFRERLQQALRAQPGAQVLFGCDEGADVSQLAGPGVVTLSLPCSGMLPPAFTEYALRAGASRVIVATCGEHGCAFRLGGRWTAERLQGLREPFLRRPSGTVQLIDAPRGEEPLLQRALQTGSATPSSPTSEAPHV
ncbi:MAG: cytochrome b N-terminal domain-containing protein [Hylemonella sp.]|nr:cytochrome b N-terminal domain-containing protein [Hylemonella sp.]